MSPASRQLMPESSTAINTSGEPVDRPQARSTAAPFWPQWFCGEPARAGRASRHDVRL
jgi:hypothetical protein